MLTVLFVCLYIVYFSHLQYMILSVSLASTFFKYLIHAFDAHRESRGQHWPGKMTFMFYVEFFADLIKFVLYLGFFFLICTHYGLPLHLIRELGITFYNLRERVIKFIQFRRITRNMKERFPDATQEELNQGDKTCIVCREDMEVGHTKKSERHEKGITDNARACFSSFLFSLLCFVLFLSFF